MAPVSAILLDIEGTTTSIRFVHEILFPFARTHMSAFLVERWGDPAVQADVAGLLLQQQADSATLPSVTSPLAGADAATRRAAALNCALRHMDLDRKTTALKSLQGKIWEAGYATGELKADVFDDVPDALARWTAAGLAVAIYSSGSVPAQRLLFGHTHRGDLTPHLSAFFDTTTGPKQERASYARIAEALGLAPEAVLFATDVVEEALAARAAGMRAVIMDRPGNAPQPPHDFEVWADFSAFDPTQTA